jgi:predicted metal-dependent enzyme (double-stranded beta helix superfamily)
METGSTALEQLSSYSQGLIDSYLSSARETLRQLTASPDLLNGIALDRAPGFFTRNLIFGDNRISVWAMVWSPGASTPIHDHHCSCCFAVLRGTIREVQFQPIGADQVVKVAEHLRQPGYTAAMLPSGPNIHQMINDGPDEAISIHIYGYDHRMHASSIHRKYQPVEN